MVLDASVTYLAAVFGLGYLLLHYYEVKTLSQRSQDAENSPSKLELRRLEGILEDVSNDLHDRIDGLQQLNARHSTRKVREQEAEKPNSPFLPNNYRGGK